MGFYRWPSAPGATGIASSPKSRLVILASKRLYPLSAIACDAKNVVNRIITLRIVTPQPQISAGCTNIACWFQEEVILLKHSPCSHSQWSWTTIWSPKSASNTDQAAVLNARRIVKEWDFWRSACEASCNLRFHQRSRLAKSSTQIMPSDREVVWPLNR